MRLIHSQTDRPGTDPIKILQRKFYATLFFQAFSKFGRNDKSVKFNGKGFEAFKFTNKSQTASLYSQSTQA